MQTQQRNKIIEKNKTQKNPATERHFAEKEEKEASSSCIDMNFHAIQTGLTKNADCRSSRISTCLQKHIEYLEKKLTDAEAQTNKAKLYSEILETKLDEKCEQNDTLLSKVGENQKAVKQLLFKYEMLLSDHQNLKLKHKMERLHRQINEQKETQSQISLKNRQLKQGKYSDNFLPSPFDSPNKTFEQKTEKNELILDNLSNPSLEKSMKSSPKQKNPINSHLVDEYQRLKQQRVKKQKQISQLRAQNCALKLELDARNKQNIKLLSERSNKSVSLSNQLIKWKGKVQVQRQQNKMLFNKLKQTQMKMIQLSQLVKNGTNIDYIEMSDIRRIIEDGKNKHYPQSNNMDVNIIKYEKDCQTQEIINPELQETQKMQQYIIKIASLKSELLERTKQYNKREEQYRNKFGSELRKCTELMECYRSRAESFTQDIIQQKEWRLTKSGILDNDELNNQMIQESTQKQFKDAQVQCLLIPSDILQERQYILQKAKIFIDFNEQQKNIIDKLTIQKMQLKEQISQEQNFKITMLEKERNNFSNIYSELRKNYDKLEVDFQKEIHRLKEQAVDKENQLNNLTLELEVLSSQMSLLKERIAYYQHKVGEYQKQIEKYQLKLEICNQQIDALRQNP